MQAEQAIDRYPPADTDKAIPLKVRQTFPAKRQALAAEFARLSVQHRRAHAHDFRERLRAICASDLEQRGYWQLKFEPLLAGGMPAPAESRPALAQRKTTGKAPAKPPPSPQKRQSERPSRRPPPAQYAQTEIALLALVRAHPGH